MKSKVRKIVHVLLSLEIGGLENGLINLINNSSDQFEHIICCLEKRGPMAHRLKKPIPIHEMHWKGGKSWRLPFHLASVFRQQQCHIVRCMNTTSLLYGYPSAKIARVPIVVYSHGGRLFPEKKRILIIEKFMANRVDQVITVSDELRESMIKHVGIREEKIKTIENGVCIRRFEVSGKIKKSGLGLREDTLVIGTNGRLTTEKDYPTMLKAFKSVSEEIEDVALIIIGEGPHKNMLERLVHELSLGNKVHFLGIRQDIPDLMQIMDIFVLSALWEGFSNVILEAMASELPVVATDVGDNHKMVINEVTGYLVPPRGVQEIKETAIKLLNSPSLRKSMGKEGKKLVEDRFTIARMAMQYEETFANLISMVNVKV